mmetsp:Transcript_15031/g.14504  ORF Transcript_15031/g.14504 Transcript_15031/m.14504 type:complete len:86 (+) Transcript_15031:323-580(+)
MTTPMTRKNDPDKHPPNKNLKAIDNPDEESSGKKHPYSYILPPLVKETKSSILPCRIGDTKQRKRCNLELLRLLEPSLRQLLAQA